ncbi:restriction endonuclease [Glycomyces buryatensis]|uniref:Restriction endonuclease n=1 Tax=Glycomyces buryatensis TaxID=2570927 RepID=A0A4S8PYM8_9ACTN|nr:restriction endonuclease [Glycomyces buryatensis]THV35781.1 restriction endonuclease [Glycomyces buryatensis]
MSVFLRVGAGIAVLILGYFALGFVADHWAWFASVAILLGGTATAAWVLFRSRGGDRHERTMTPERQELMRSVGRMNIPTFDATVAQLLVRLDAKRIKKFGHRQNDLGCNFVVTFNNGKRIIVRAKKDDRAMKRQNGTRHVQILGGEIKARWDCDAGVLITNANLHWLHHSARNEAVAAQLGVLIIDHNRLAEWIDTGLPPAELRMAPAQLTGSEERQRETTSAHQ